MENEAARPFTPRATASEVELRIEIMSGLLLDGLSRGQILQFVTDKLQWGLEERQIDVYIARARKVIKKLSDFKRDEEFAKSVGRLNRLYAKNIRINDFKAALAVQKELNALFDLYPASKVEQTGALTIKVVYDSND